ncbi:MAG: ATP-grasp domain-containing protein [Chloroflexi bacterium]|nr:ATP-grasp domain-containing protein [Chloroflexota bacterium]MCI0580722.1 ATP-grasp domain-containing protein [Chloroflexota bacterium]MCI0646639.1 ATP-grasp domain-containing protein [Chloroflexota bacterium]MCI0729222.1 ATP-grasp domain-containing protein [Chloroflexota bacterium]
MVEPDSSTVLVTDAGRGSAIHIIRSLGQKGWRVIAADADPRSPGFRSRYTHAHVVYPDPRAAPQATIHTLRQAVDRWQVTLVIPVTDEIIHPLNCARDRFPQSCQLALAEPQVLARVTSKEETTQLARQLAIPLPQTVTVHTVAEARSAAAEMRWPLVLKPDVSRRYDLATEKIETNDVAYAADPAGLERQVAHWEGRCAVLLQEYCPGVGQGVELLAYCGRPLAAFQHRRLAEVPLTGGASAWREAVPLDPKLYDYAVRLLNVLCWTGLIMVEFKVAGDTAWLMEINGRVWGSLPLAIFSGMDFPARLAALYRDGPPPAGRSVDTAYRVGVRAVNEDLMILWFAHMLAGRKRHPFIPIPPRRQALAGLWALLDPRQRLDVWDRTDPRPGLAQAGKIIRKIIRKIGSKSP